MGVRMARRGGALATVACALLAVAPAAYADTPQRLVPDEDEELACQRVTSCQTGGYCAGNTTCTTVQGATNNNDPGCAFSPGFTRDALCCGAAADCGHRDGVDGECVQVEGFNNDVCIFPGSDFSLCGTDSTTLSVSTMRECFRDPYTNNLQDDWREGDCDGDGTANEDDCAPCDPNQVCPDGGVGDPDAGVDGGTPMDGGMDGGSSPGDAGMDGGTYADAMAPEDGGMDGGSTHDDGGFADGGPMSADGGATDGGAVDDASAMDANAGSMAGTPDATPPMDAGASRDGATINDAQPGGKGSGGSSGSGSNMGGSGNGGSGTGQPSDAAAERGPGVTFRGGGGCAALPGARRAPLPAWVLVTGLLLFRLRRRAAAR